LRHVDPTPAPPGTPRRKVEYLVVGLVGGVAIVSVVAIVCWLGAAFGLWGNAGFGPEWVGGE
jgi:hypothetical protein